MDRQEEEDGQKSNLEAKLASFTICAARGLLGIGKHIASLFDAQKVEEPFSGPALEPREYADGEFETIGNISELKRPNFPDNKKKRMRLDAVHKSN